MTLFFRIWVNKFRDLPIVHAVDVKTKFYVTKRTFWKRFSWEKDTNIYLFMASLMKIWLARKFQVCQKGILGVQRNISGKNFLEEKKLFLTFMLSTRLFRVSGETKLTELPKLHSKCPEIHFHFLSKKNISLILFSDFERKISVFFAFFGHVCQTRILRVQRPYWKKSRIRFIFNFPEFWRKLWFALKNYRFVRKDFFLQENYFLGKTKLLYLYGSERKMNGCPSKYD